MSVTALTELSNELRRLAVAGAGLAAGDRCVAALVPALEAGGGRAPVLATIAARTNALLAASRHEAPTELMALAALVTSVLKASARTGVDGDMAPPPPCTAAPKAAPARLIRELRESLGGGRVQTLRDALDHGWFGDVRLAPFALDALQSEHSGIARLASTRMLPSYGRTVVPLLVASLDLSLGRPASRVIDTVRRIDPDDGAALARQVLDPEARRRFAVRTDGVTISDEATAAALECLRDTDADRAALADFAGARKKAVRVAALRRWLELGDAAAEAHAVAMLCGSPARSREAAEAIPELAVESMTTPLVARAHRLAEALGREPVSTADANEAARLLSLLVHSPADEARANAARALFERADVLSSRSGALCAKALRARPGYLSGTGRGA